MMRRLDLKSNPFSKPPRFEPYWYPIVLFWVGASLLFLYHLQTGITPSRVALHIRFLQFDIFWYGILIVAGIALGAYVTSRLALARARRIFQEDVPADLQTQPITALALPAEIQEILAKRKIHTFGHLLFRWGLNPADLGLNAEGLSEVHQRLLEAPGVKADWVADAPWRPWNPEHVWNGVAWCLVLGVIGARLYHVLTPSPSMAAVGIHSPLDYFRQPFQLINLRMGGLGIYGGIAGGLLGLAWYTWRNRLPTIAWADLAAVGLALGQVIGRWGNFFNQELYGRPTNLPWAITIDPEHRLPGYTELGRFHPAFLYESLWNFLAFVVLLALARRYQNKLKTGDLMALYLIFYATGRTLLETVRLDSRAVVLAGLDLRLPVATLVSIIIALAMAAWMGWRHFKGRT